jgi:hypothetical protein
MIGFAILVIIAARSTGREVAHAATVVSAEQQNDRQAEHDGERPHH